VDNIGPTRTPLRPYKDPNMIEATINIIDSTIAAHTS
jgi:hypothetical protein